MTSPTSGEPSGEPRPIEYTTHPDLTSEIDGLFAGVSESALDISEPSIEANEGWGRLPAAQKLLKILAFELEKSNVAVNLANGEVPEGADIRELQNKQDEIGECYDLLQVTVDVLGENSSIDKILEALNRQQIELLSSEDKTTETEDDIAIHQALLELLEPLSTEERISRYYRVNPDFRDQLA